MWKLPAPNYNKEMAQIVSQMYVCICIYLYMYVCVYSNFMEKVAKSV